MRARLLVPLSLLVFSACKDKDGDSAGSLPPTWDPEAPAIACAVGAVDAPLLDQALVDADIAAEDVGYTEGEWSRGSYARYLDDAYRLSWFYDYQYTPLRYPCLGGQASADLDQAIAGVHPVAAVLGEAMALLGVPLDGEPLDPASTPQDLVDLSSLPADLADALTPVVAAMVLAAEARSTMAEGAFVDLDELVEYGHGGVILPGDAEPDFAVEEEQAWVLSDVGPRILYNPARVLAFAIEEADLARFVGTDATLDADTDIGRFVVAGPGDDAPGDIGNVAFYLDLGGNDTYVHPAAASDQHVPVSVHVDLGGNDAYGYLPEDDGDDALLPADEDGRYRGDTNYGRFSLSTIGRQGSGRAGVALLYDLGRGDDTYQSLKVSQGWGHLGVGVLFDDYGNDTYLGEEGVQGGAAMGLGLLLDLGGDDIHRTFTASQGFGYLQAVGMALDGEGNDTWYANPGREEDGGTVVYYSPQMPGTANHTASQGFGFGRRGDYDGAFLSGGVGILRDRGGDDTYTAGLFSQGAGYWQAVGMLLDGAGSDQYDAYWYVQGGAAHYAAGLLLDDGEGDDRMNTNMTPVYVQLGTGHDMSVGVYINEQGDDTYVYGGLAAGSSNCQGVGLFVDNDGSDTYEVSSAYSTGLGNHSGECDSTTRTQAESTGIFLDSGGDADSWTWPEGDRPAPADDTTFGWEQTGDENEHGGAADGDGETSLHAAGE